MENSRFKIVFDGSLMPQSTLEDTQQNLARLFKSDVAKIAPLFSGKPVVLKRDLSESEAETYLRALRDAGANASKELDLAASLTLEEVDETAEQVPRMQCPRCGEDQPKSATCVACGIVIEKYLARQVELAKAPADAATSAADEAPQTVVETAPASATPYAPPKAQVAENLPEFGPLKVLTINGRIGRVRYMGWSAAISWIFMLALGLSALMGMVLAPLGIVLAAAIYISWLVLYVMISVQRLHDIGWSGWFLLLDLIPFVGSICALLRLILPSTPGANKYGAPPPPNSSGVIALAWSWLAIPVLVGIIAAIATPMYADYTNRAKSAYEQGIDHSYEKEQGEEYSEEYDTDE